MSNQEENSQEGVCLTDLNELYIDSDDLNNVKAFFDHFKIERPAYLDESIDQFTKKAAMNADKQELIALQNNFRAALCTTMVESEHPLFRDELFSVVRVNSQQVAFNKHFNEQVNAALGIGDLLKK